MPMCSCGKPGDPSRPLPFAGNACSAICELMISDLLDGCGIDETEALADELRQDPERLKLELKQRRIRP